MSIPARRGTETNNLVNVIDVIELGRKTGVLSVEREINMHLEQGQITFTRGQVTLARSNHTRSEEGQAALQWLRTWKACRFLFEEVHEMERTTNPLLVAQQDRGIQRRDTEPQGVPTRTEAARKSEFDNLAMVPQRILYAERALHIIEHAQLSRTHRQLFLLVDGQRSVAELLMLLRRKSDEGLKLVRDLVSIGVIR